MQDDIPFAPETDEGSGYLLGERLEPHESAKIEAALRSAEAPAPRHSRRWPWISGAAAASLILAVAWSVFPRGEPQRPGAEAVPAVGESREMVLEIVRTDLPDAKRYTLIIKFEPGGNRDTEVDR